MAGRRGRRGDGAWIVRAKRLAARMTELGGPKEDAIKRVAAEAQLSVTMARRYVDACEHLAQFSGQRIALSLNTFEHYKGWMKVDPQGAAAARDAALAGEIPLSRIQAATREARVRASTPPGAVFVPVDDIVERFRASGKVLIPEGPPVRVPARGEVWIGLSADAAEMADDGEPYLWHRWALLLSPGVPGSPLAGLTFDSLLLRVAAAGAIYDRVSVLCSSVFEAGELAKASQVWWPRGQDKLSILCL